MKMSLSISLDQSRPPVYNMKGEILQPLIKEDVHNRQILFGKNIIEKHATRKWYTILFQSIFDPFNLLLIGIATLSFYLDDIKMFVIMTIMVSVSAGIRFYNENKNESKLSALTAMIKKNITVIRRDSNDLESDEIIDIRDCVPGDFVKLKAGDLVPAEIQLIKTNSLLVDQCVLTGESMPSMNQSLQSAFNKRIKRVSLLFIVLMVLILVPIILLKGLDIFKQQEEENENQGHWILALQFALSVAIGVTPEMLPMILNANLAKGSISLSNKNCIVKRIESIINLGNMNILCTDKTGTLTENFAKLTNVYDFKRVNCSLGLELGYLNSAFQESFKNLTDQAIINAYEELAEPIRDFESSQSQFVKINEIPFDFNRRKMSVIYEYSDVRLLCTKGSVKEMLDVCSFYMDQQTASNNVLSLDYLFRILSLSKDIKLEQEENALEFKEKDFSFNYSINSMTSEMVQQLLKFNNQLNKEGNRVIAIAYQVEPIYVDRSKSGLIEKNLIFVGFLTLVNPPKQSVRMAIEDLTIRNVKIKVLTGDTVEICKNICKEIGLSTDHVITSKQMNSMTRVELEKLVYETVIFSQLTPIQKLEIIKMLKEQGNVVGFLGDGINDALALKEADVGISVDSGTEIAKEAADIILLEKDLKVINTGITEGRKAFINIVKYIAMVVSSNFGNVVSIFVSTLWLPFLPMLPIHLLLQNLFYDLSQMTMPWDHVDLEDVSGPEEFKLRNLIIFMAVFGPISSIFDIATFAYFWFFRGFNDIKNNDDPRALIFQTGWFTVGVLTQTLIVHIARTHKTPILQSNASIQVYISTTICLIVGLIAPYLPLGSIYDMAHLDLDFYYWLIFTLIAYSETVQLTKKFYIIAFKSWFVPIR